MGPFTTIASFLSTFFGPTTIPPIKGSQGTALQSTTASFVGIGNVLLEGGVSSPYAELAMNRLYEARLAVDAAIAHGWNNGKPSQY